MKSENQVYNEILGSVKNIIIADDDKEALDSLRAIIEYQKHLKLKENNPDIFEKFQKLITILKWIALPLLKKEEVIDLFNESLESSFKIEEYDFKGKLKSFLLGVEILEERDEIKRLIRSILLNSPVSITSERLINNSQPSVANWIKSYVSIVGIDSEDAIKISQFYTSDENFNALNEIEKKRIKNFFSFFERLKYSSKTIQGVEESIPVANGQESGYIVDGKLVKSESVKDLKFDKIFSIVSKTLGGDKLEADVFDELNKPIAAPIKPLVVGSVTSTPTPVIPTPLVVRESAFSMPTKPMLTAEQAKQIAELTALATSYAEGSLERRVIEDEVKKIEQKA